MVGVFLIKRSAAEEIFQPPISSNEWRIWRWSDGAEAGARFASSDGRTAGLRSPSALEDATLESGGANLRVWPQDAITDVAEVAVGHTTLIRGDDIETGVTAILPHTGNLFREKVAGAVFVGNAFGKLVGSTQVNELA